MILSTFETIDWVNKRGYENFVSVALYVVRPQENMHHQGGIPLGNNWLVFGLRSKIRVDLNFEQPLHS